MKHLENRKPRNKPEPSELSSINCVRSITKGLTIYRTPPGMIIYLNITFSVPDKWLYTLYNGITVTLRVAQASSVSAYG
jgi:hypothetical protein